MLAQQQADVYGQPTAITTIQERRDASPRIIQLARLFTHSCHTNSRARIPTLPNDVIFWIIRVGSKQDFSKRDLRRRSLHERSQHQSMKEARKSDTHAIESLGTGNKLRFLLFCIFDNTSPRRDLVVHPRACRKADEISPSIACVLSGILH